MATFVHISSKKDGDFVHISAQNMVTFVHIQAKNMAIFVHILAKNMTIFTYTEIESGTCIKGLFWPPLEPKTENCFLPI